MSVMSDWQEDKNSPGADVEVETGVLQEGEQQEEEDMVEEEMEEGVLLQEEDRNKMVQMFNEKGRLCSCVLSYTACQVANIPRVYAHGKATSTKLWHCMRQSCLDHAVGALFWHSLWGHLE